MKFYYFHLMPYVMDHDEPSSWVTLSNRRYDPAVGHTLYHQYLDQLEYAEALGWEHHARPGQQIQLSWNYHRVVDINFDKAA